MMRRTNLLSCYAAVSSVSSPRVVRGSAGCCRFRGRAAAFSPPPHLYLIGARCAGSNSFREKFLKANVRGNDADANDDDGDKGPSPSGEREEEDDDAAEEPSPNDGIRSRTREWIERVVIGYNLCPFAERPMREGKLKVSVVRGDDDHEVAGAVVYEMIARSDESQAGTTVVVAPDYFPDDFERYMSLVRFIEESPMEDLELDGKVQIAPFHPQFEFEGSGKEGVDNHTNRSPYPMFHILREDEVGRAVAKLGGDASKVWSRNIRLLELMQERWGASGVEKAMRGDEMDGVDALLKEVKSSSYFDSGSDT
ncbi:hypothetical protein ACHAWF_019056 [Thalassiosira exigua]